MKKKYVYSLAATLLMGFAAMGGLTSCDKDKLIAEEELQVVNKEEVPVTEEVPATEEVPVVEEPQEEVEKVYNFKLSATLNEDADTRYVEFSEDGMSVIAKFDAVDRIAVFIERGSTIAYGYDENLYCYASLTLTDISDDGNTAELTGAMKFYTGTTGNRTSFEPQANDVIHLLYNMDYLNPANSDGRFKYSGQELSKLYTSKYDYAEAKMVVTGVNVDESGSCSLTLGQPDNPDNPKVCFQNIGTFFRQQLSFEGQDGNPVTNPTIKKVIIDLGDNHFVEAYDPLSTDNKYVYSRIEINDPNISSDGNIYFVMMFTDDNKNDALKLTAFDDAGNIYSLTKNAPSSGFSNNIFYRGSATLKWSGNTIPTVSGTSASPVQQSGFPFQQYQVGENPVNITISGYSDGYSFLLQHGGTVNLDNLTASVNYARFIDVKTYSFNVTINLTGTNNLTCPDYNECIGYCTTKLSCTGTSATLTVTSKGNKDCGLNAYNYSKNGSGDTYNYYSTTTELDVSTQLAASGYKVVRSARTDNADGTYTWTYTVTKL